jgi:hypothetical protein
MPSYLHVQGGGYSSHPTPVTWYGNGQSTQYSRWVIRPTRRTVTNFIFYSKFSVHDILQCYFGTGEDNKALVFVKRHQMSCSRFHSFPAGHDPLEPKQPSSSFIASYQLHSAVPVVFQNQKDSVMRVAGILWVPTMRSRDILLQANGDHLDQVHLYQMVLEMIRRGTLEFLRY